MMCTVFSRTREGSCVWSLDELFREMPHFYECCIYSIHCCLAIVTTVLLLLSYTCLSFRFLVAHFSVCLYLRPSLTQPLPICAGPFLPHGIPSPLPLETVSHCHDDLRDVSRCYFSARHSVAAYNVQYSSSHLPRTSLEHLLFLLCEWPCLSTRNTQDFLCLSFSIVCL
jgi:hypothetical protein